MVSVCGGGLRVARCMTRVRSAARATEGGVRLSTARSLTPCYTLRSRRAVATITAYTKNVIVSITGEDIGETLMKFRAVEKGYHWVMTLAGAREALSLIQEQEPIERSDLQARVDVSPMQIVKVLDSMAELQILTRKRAGPGNSFSPWLYSKGPMWDKFYRAHQQLEYLQMQVKRESGSAIAR